MAIRKYGSKTGGIIAGVFFIIALVFFGVFWLIGMQMHKYEINKMISSKNGEILSIKEVKLEDSPFLDTMESRIGKRKGHGNTFYKIEYTISSTKHIAWFRGVNGPFVPNRETTDYYGNIVEELPDNKGKIREYGQRWIFEDDY